MRFLGLDYGDKTIGVAVSDPANRISLGVETIRRAEAGAIRLSVRRLGALIKQYGVTHIVLGYPKHMDNGVSERCEKTLDFKARLERNFKSVPVILWDERLSTQAVTRVFSGKREQYEAHVDEMAAVYILQGYLSNREAAMQNELNESFEWEEDDEDGAITMFDDEGNESHYHVLASREDNGCMYLLVEEALDGEDNEDGDEDVEAEVLHFKCVSPEEEEMIFEWVDEEHEDFEKVFKLFKDDYEALGIEISGEDL